MARDLEETGMKIHTYVKGTTLTLALLVLMSAPAVSPVLLQFQYPQAIAAESSMAKIQLILKKLRGSMTSMKDFDELEKAGMPKKVVDRMRRAMSHKIKQLTEEAISSIQSL